MTLKDWFFVFLLWLGLFLGTSLAPAAVDYVMEVVSHFP